MAGGMKSKLQQLREAWAAGDKRAALAIAARFGNLGEERDAILTGHGAIQNPRFYRGLGSDPAALEAAAYKALAERYGLE
jgi:hypothetical protein